MKKFHATLETSSSNLAVCSWVSSELPRASPLAINWKDEGKLSAESKLFQHFANKVHAANNQTVVLCHVTLQFGSNRSAGFQKYDLWTTIDRMNESRMKKKSLCEAGSTATLPVTDWKANIKIWTTGDLWFSHWATLTGWSFLEKSNICAILDLHQLKTENQLIQKSQSAEYGIKSYQQNDHIKSKKSA